MNVFTVKLSALRTTAHKLRDTTANVRAGRKTHRRGDPIEVTRCGSRTLCVMDGHHRVVEAVMTGAKTIEAFLTEFNPDLRKVPNGHYASLLRDLVHVTRLPADGLVKLDRKGCRIWTAPRSIMRLLPGEDDVPRHKLDRYDHVMSETDARDLDYITCQSCQWHVDEDFHSPFRYVVCRGRANLLLGPDSAETTHLMSDPTPKQTEKVFIKRGDCIQLWPHIPHRVHVWGGMTLLSMDYDEERARGWSFWSNAEFEADLLDNLRTHKKVTAS